MISELRDELRKARALAEPGDVTGVLRAIDEALGELRDDRPVTVAQAAEMLRVRSPEALAVLMRVNGVQMERRADTFWTTLAEVERIENSEWIRDMRILDQLHDLADPFGFDRPITQEEMDALSAGRPGTLPWKRPKESTLDRPA